VIEIATITRPSVITGRPHTRNVYIVREWDTYRGIEMGRPVVVTNAPGHPYEMHEVLSASEQATIHQHTDECDPGNCEFAHAQHFGHEEV
jgi:hypothetical protein